MSDGKLRITGKLRLTIVVEYPFDERWYENSNGLSPAEIDQANFSDDHGAMVEMIHNYGVTSVTVEVVKEEDNE